MNTKKTYSEFVHVDLVLIRFHRPLWLTELQWRFNRTTALYIPSRHIKRAHKKARARADGWCMTQRERERESWHVYLCALECVIVLAIRCSYVNTKLWFVANLNSLYMVEQKFENNPTIGNPTIPIGFHI